MSYGNIREEELKNKISHDYFNIFDCTKIVGNIDFCVTLQTQKKQAQIFEIESLFWAEAKKGNENEPLYLVTDDKILDGVIIFKYITDNDGEIQYPIQSIDIGRKIKFLK